MDLSEATSQNRRFDVHHPINAFVAHRLKAYFLADLQDVKLGGLPNLAHQAHGWHDQILNLAVQERHLARGLIDVPHLSLRPRLRSGIMAHK